MRIDLTALSPPLSGESVQMRFEQRGIAAQLVLCPPTAEALLYGVMLLQKKIRRTGTIERGDGPSVWRRQALRRLWWPARISR